jgi:HPt (histidine-containing phosphotransfer) domain-containing protein
MNDHVAKPVDPQQMFETLLRWLPAQPQPVRAAVDDGPTLDPALGQRLAADYADAYQRAMTQFASMYAPGGEGDAALRAADPVAQAAALHSLRGAAATLGELQVQSLAQACEAALAQGRAAPLAPLLAELQRLTQSLGVEAV